MYTISYKNKAHTGYRDVSAMRMNGSAYLNSAQVWFLWAVSLKPKPATVGPKEINNML